MKTNTVSVRRRQMIIAGCAGAAVPGSLFAGQCTAGARVSDAALAATRAARADKLILSGRIVDGACAAVAGALVQAPHDRSTAVTDADGRFMLVASPASGAASQSLRLVVSHAAHGTRDARVHMARGDQARTGRATLEVALA